MKQFESKVEGAWVEKVQVQLTVEQRTLLMSTDEADASAKATLRTYIKDNNEVAVSTEKATALTAFYETKKPTIKVGDTYHLIAMSITERVENAFSGILNCRVNEEHVQVRF